MSSFWALIIACIHSPLAAGFLCIVLKQYRSLIDGENACFKQLSILDFCLHFSQFLFLTHFWLSKMLLIGEYYLSKFLFICSSYRSRMLFIDEKIADNEAGKKLKKKSKSKQNNQGFFWKLVRCHMGFTDFSENKFQTINTSAYMQILKSLWDGTQ